MKILVAHNFYKWPGGEDQSMAAEVAMLQARGHEVTQYVLTNESIGMMSRPQLAQVALRTIWSGRRFASYDKYSERVGHKSRVSTTHFL
jgi:hypothetical protein